MASPASDENDKEFVRIRTGSNTIKQQIATFDTCIETTTHECYFDRHFVILGEKNALYDVKNVLI
mgnify:CR=1 FL=1